MSKLYYTDPLKAAWMAREFGVELQEITPASIKNIIDFELINPNETGQWYIHPDSYSIFQPKVGDLYRDCDGWYFTILEEVDYEALPDHVSSHFILIEMIMDTCDVGSPEFQWFLENCQIVERDDRAFFMPEVENE